MKKIVIFFAVIINMQAVFAQEGKSAFKKEKLVFRSFNTVGLLYNTESIHIGAQSVNGFSKKGTFIGLGAGVDWYGISSLPIFLDLRQQIKWGKNTFFVYGDLGYNIAWIDSDGGNQGFSSEYDNDGGLYYDFGAGYLIPKTGVGFDARFNFGISKLNDNNLADNRSGVFQVGMFYLFNQHWK